eukprot:7391476-Prymnesium_polylepis.2
MRHELRTEQHTPPGSSCGACGKRLSAAQAARSRVRRVRARAESAPLRRHAHHVAASKLRALRSYLELLDDLGVALRVGRRLLDGVVKVLSGGTRQMSRVC